VLQGRNVTYLQYIKVLLNEDLETMWDLEEPVTRNKKLNSCSKGQKCNTCLFPCADLFANGSKPKPLLELTYQECREHWAPTVVQSPHQAAYPPTSLYFCSYPTIQNLQSACTAKINFFILAGNTWRDTHQVNLEAFVTKATLWEILIQVLQINVQQMSYHMSMIFMVKYLHKNSEYGIKLILWFYYAVLIDRSRHQLAKGAEMMFLKS
jgi:hypothetical protein